MQTFLPYADFRQTALVLDRQRLGKQRVEVKQILKALRGESKGWTRHPAVLMWRGYETALSLYGMEVCRAWRERGYKDSLLPEFTAIFVAGPPLEKPPWLGDARIHLSHQSNLIRKDSVYYRPLFGEQVPEDLPYYWAEPLGGKDED